MPGPWSRTATDARRSAVPVWSSIGPGAYVMAFSSRLSRIWSTSVAFACAVTGSPPTEMRGRVRRRSFPPAVRRALGGVVQLDLGRPALLQRASHHEQPVDRGCQPVDLPVGGGEVVRHLGGIRSLDRRLQAELHPGERCPQLVRSVRHELALRLDGALDAVGHLVERARQLLDLVGAGDVVSASGEIAGAEPARGPGESRERARERARHDDGDHQTDGQTDPSDDRDQAERRPADRRRSRSGCSA